MSSIKSLSDLLSHLRSSDVASRSALLQATTLIALGGTARLELLIRNADSAQSEDFAPLARWLVAFWARSIGTELKFDGNRLVGHRERAKLYFHIKSLTHDIEPRRRTVDRTAWFDAMCDALISGVCGWLSSHTAENSVIRLIESESLVIALAVAHAYRQLGVPQCVEELWAADAFAVQRFLDRVERLSPTTAKTVIGRAMRWECFPHTDTAIRSRVTQFDRTRIGESGAFSPTSHKGRELLHFASQSSDSSTAIWARSELDGIRKPAIIDVQRPVDEDDFIFLARERALGNSRARVGDAEVAWLSETLLGTVATPASVDASLSTLAKAEPTFFSSSSPFRDVTEETWRSFAHGAGHVLALWCDTHCTTGVRLSKLCKLLMRAPIKQKKAWHESWVAGGSATADVLTLVQCLNSDVHEEYNDFQNILEAVLVSRAYQHLPEPAGLLGIPDKLRQSLLIRFAWDWIARADLRNAAKCMLGWPSFPSEYAYQWGGKCRPDWFGHSVVAKATTKRQDCADLAQPPWQREIANVGSSPATSLRALRTSYRSAVLTLIYVSKADGLFSRKERAIVMDACRALTGNDRLTPTHLTKLFKGFQWPSRSTYEKSVVAAARVLSGDSVLLVRAALSSILAIPGNGSDEQAEAVRLFDLHTQASQESKQ